MCYWYLQGPIDHAYRCVQYVSIYKYNIHIWFLYVLYYIRKKFFVIYQYHIYLSPNQRKCYIRCALGCPQQRWPSAGVHGCCCDERYSPTFPEWWVVQHHNICSNMKGLQRCFPECKVGGLWDMSKEMLIEKWGNASQSRNPKRFGSHVYAHGSVHTQVPCPCWPPSLRFSLRSWYLTWRMQTTAQSANAALKLMATFSMCEEDIFDRSCDCQYVNEFIFFVSSDVDKPFQHENASFQTIETQRSPSTCYL